MSQNTGVGVRSWLQRISYALRTPPERTTPNPAASGRVVSEQFFNVSPVLAEQLRATRSASTLHKIERELDAFLLDPGLGPTTYLTRDGRVIWEGDDLWGPIEPSMEEACMAIVVGAKKTGVVGLLELLPTRTSDATDCQACRGSGWFAHELLRDANGRPFTPVCHSCGGLGWRRGVVAMPADIATWVQERIATYQQEAPEPLRWLAPYVSRRAALPLLHDWRETAGIRADGGLVWWSTEGTYVGARPVIEPRERNIVLAEGSRRYPQLACLVPVRPSDALDCPHCHGRFLPPKLPPNVVCYCGGLGWVPPELPSKRG